MLKCLRPIFTKGKRLNLCKMSTKTPVDIAGKKIEVLIDLNSMFDNYIFISKI